MAKSESEELFADRYRVVELLGEGGMGRVLKCHDRELDRYVAIKVLSSETKLDAIKRFQKEAVATARLKHPNVVEVYDFGETDGAFYLVMDYLEGESLDRYLARAGTLSWEETREIGLAICAGLAHAHGQGIVHRDLKPSNVLISTSVDGESRIKIVDFGIAKELDATSTLTGADLIIGTPAYISPEAVRGSGVSPASDIYSLGCILYECLTGEKPILGDSAMATMMLKLEVDPPSLRDYFEEETGAIIDSIIVKCLARDPKMRYGSAGELANVLEQSSISTTTDGDIGVAEENSSVSIKREGGFKRLSLFLLGSLIILLVAAFLTGYLFREPEAKREVKREVKLITPALLTTEESAALGTEKHCAYVQGNGTVQVDPDFNDADLKNAADTFSDKSIWMLKESAIKGPGLQYLEPLKVTLLDLSRNTLRPGTMARIVRLPYLRKLILIGCSGIEDRDLSQLKELNNLMMVSVSGPGITGGACEYLSELSKLQAISLREVSLKEEDLRQLSKLPQLTSLGLSSCKMNSRTASVIADLPGLTRLKLAKCRLDKKVAAAIAKSKTINNLDLSQVEASSAAILSMKTLPLKTLRLSDTRVDEITKNNLKNSLTGCEIFY
ncbi:MAG: protein kinase [Candidatus Obscuribacterales bacterium]|nr:protein kinase [Cyanobacteria bacterium HKST-UBA01]MCB9471879.1 protein kinase [Candidatus Obscuribacterales bacterium]